MKNLHVEHIKTVVKILFPDIAEKAKIRILNPEIDLFPNYLSHELIPGGNMIEVNFTIEISDIDEYRTRLNKFINKYIRVQINRGSSILYWFEDEFIYGTHEELNINDSFLNANRLKSETRLPWWLDKYIFNSLHAVYSPDHQRFGYNLDNDSEEQLIYLGTYFPRSYGESFCIAEGIIKNGYYSSVLESKHQINILDIGCGTGGSTLGLLGALTKKLPDRIPINIYVVDGNEEALKIFEKIINRINYQSSRKINTQIFNTKFKRIYDITELVDSFDESRFDYIISFKTICELILKGGVEARNSFYDFNQLFSKFLTPEGLLITLDVTSRIIDLDYLPILLNRQIVKFIKENPAYKVFSPISCFFYGDQCDYQCFYQHTFLISHQHINNDQSRVAYKIIGHKKFIDFLSKDFKKSKFIINWKHYPDINDPRCFCPYSVNEIELCDSYKIF